MPSPVPMSCSRKSLYGWMTLLPSAAPTVKAPPLITVPTDAVVIDGVWQILQPIALNRFDPATALAVAASAVSRGGTLVARKKLAKAVMSSSLSSPHVWPARATGVHGWLSGTGSNPLPKPTNLPIDVFSTRLNLFVIPISFRYASDENESRLACWFFHPNRPPRTAPLASSTGT